MLAMLPQFVDPAAGPVALQMLVLGATMKATGLLTLGSVAMGSGAVGGWLARHKCFVAWQERFAGLVMIWLGVRLILGADLRSLAR
jgi:threonine/homoserine/homoserine lactone efflux protein